MGVDFNLAGKYKIIKLDAEAPLGIRRNLSLPWFRGTCKQHGTLFVVQGRKEAHRRMAAHIKRIHAVKKHEANHDPTP